MKQFKVIYEVRSYAIRELWVESETIEEAKQLVLHIPGKTLEVIGERIESGVFCDNPVLLGQVIEMEKIWQYGEKIQSLENIEFYN